MAVTTEQCFDHGSRAVPGTNPDHFRWLAEEEAALMKVGILCYDGEAMLGGILPDAHVGGILQADLPHVLGVGVFMLEGCNEAMGQILIE
jgi:hypothetical protein